MDDTSSHVLEYRSYLLSISVFLTQNEILGNHIFALGGNDECSNGALNVVGFSIFSSFANI